MRFLIENYASHNDTQALYFYEELRKNNDHEVFLWQSSQISLYDIFDKVKPEVYITHGYKLSKDFLHYSKEADYQIRLLLNVANMPQDIIFSIEQSVLNDNINCSFFFSNNLHTKTSKVRFVHINDAYDNNLAPNNPMYSIKTAYFVNNKEQICEMKDTYHFLSTNPDMKDIADIVMPELNICKLYSCYDEIVFLGLNDYIPQSFFDAIILGNKVYYDKSSESFDNIIDKMFNGENLKYSDSSKTEDFSSLKKYVAEKHTSANRLKTLLSQLPKE